MRSPVTHDHTQSLSDATEALSGYVGPTVRPPTVTDAQDLIVDLLLWVASQGGDPEAVISAAAADVRDLNPTLTSET